MNAPDWEAIDLLSMTLGGHRRAPIDPVGRRLSGLLAVLNQGLGEDNGLFIGNDAVMADHDRQVEVKGRRKADTAVTRVAVTP